jgi:hypothetical protein
LCGLGSQTFFGESIAPIQSDHNNQHNNKALCKPAARSISFECAICLESLNSESRLNPTSELPCKHRYHEGCLAELCRSNATQLCPLCRAPLISKKIPRSFADVAYTRRIEFTSIALIILWASFPLVMVSMKPEYLVVGSTVITAAAVGMCAYATCLVLTIVSGQ